MMTYLRRFWLFFALALLSPAGAVADSSTKEFVRAQAAKAAFVTDVAKIDRIADDMFRFASFAVMRMTHEHWDFDIDAVTANNGRTYAYKITTNAEDTNYDVRRFEVSLSRNDYISDETKARAQEMVELVDQLKDLSLELGPLFDAGDAKIAGDHYHQKIIPVYEAIHAAEATITTELAREIRMDAVARGN